MSNKEQESKYGFSEGIQTRIAAMIVRDQGFLSQNYEIIKPEFFDNKIIGNIIRIILKFYKKYRRGPVFDELIEEVQIFLGKNSSLPSDLYWKKVTELGLLAETADFSYVKDKIIDFARYQAVKNAIIGSVETLKKYKDYGKIMTNIKEAIMIGEDSENLGAFYFDELEERLDRRRSGHSRSQLAIPTGIDRFDKILGGGVAVGEMAILMGPMKRGKTIVSVNFGVGAAFAGYNVIHYTLESSQERTEVLYDSRISGVPKDQLLTREAEVLNAIKTELEIKTNGHKMGTIVIKKYPSGKMTAMTIEAHLQKLKMLKNFKPDLLIIDYLGLMRPADRSLKIDLSSGGKYHMLGFITKELLALAYQQNIALWVLHQSSRASKSKEKVDLEHSADSIEPMRDADLIVTLGMKKEEEEKDLQRINLFIAGGREMRDRIGVNLVLNKANCLVFDPSMEVEE